MPRKKPVAPKGTVYLAGPMRGLPEFNFPTFFKAAKHLRSLGWEVINPAEHDVDMGFDPAGKAGTTAELEYAEFDLKGAALWDLNRIINDADGIVLLPGWKRSGGAKAEYAVAKWMKLPVYEYDQHSGNGMRTHAGRTVDV